MKCNVGSSDKIVRIVLGIVLLAVALLLTLDPTVEIVIYVVAAILILTGFIRFCPLYQILGMNSCKKE